MRGSANFEDTAKYKKKARAINFKIRVFSHFFGSDNSIGFIDGWESEGSLSQQHDERSKARNHFHCS